MKENNNICKFVTVSSAPDVITTLHFVYETDIRMLEHPFTFSFYRLCFVERGTAELSSVYGRETVGENDVFLIFPATEYQLVCSGDFRYYYISFIGIRANMVIERLKITKTACVFRDMQHIRSLWEKGIVCRNDLQDLVSEGVLLHTFAAIGQRFSAQTQQSPANSAESFLHIKKYIDEHFADPELSLELLSRQFGYSEKYISYGFKKQFHIGLNAYINAQRINFAVRLMERNHSYVKEIAERCGFRDQMYFSRLFKKTVGMSPLAYIRQCK